MQVVIAESSLLVRAGIGSLLRERGHRVVAETGRAERVPALVAERMPDVLLVDAALSPSLPEEGLRAALAVRRRHADVGVVVLVRSPPRVPRQRLDALGVLLPARLDDAKTMDEALHRVLGGGLAVEPPVRPGGPPSPSPLGVLTPRERDVLDLMARGLSNHGIAERLQLTTNTVGTHVQHVFDKLGVPDSRAENRRVLAVLTYLAG